MCQKHQISLLVGYKTATPKTGDWERLLLLLYMYLQCSIFLVHEPGQRSPLMTDYNISQCACNIPDYLYSNFSHSHLPGKFRGKYHIFHTQRHPNFLWKSSQNSKIHCKVNPLCRTIDYLLDNSPIEKYKHDK